MSRKIEDYPKGTILFCEYEDGFVRRFDDAEDHCTLAEYLERIGLIVPDYCQFCRVVEPDRQIEFRHYGGVYRINIRTL